MATYTVDTTADIVDAGDGVLSLREALALADADRATADTIVFARAVQGQTIVLAGSQLTVSSDVTIDGGAGVTIDADQPSRVLLVQGGTEVGIGEFDFNEIVLAHLTVTGGEQCGAMKSTAVAAYARSRRPIDAGADQLRSAATARRIVLRRRRDLRRLRDADQQHGQRQQARRVVRRGGGISRQSVSLTNSTVSGNSSRRCRGGGIAGSDVTPDQQHGQRQQHGAG